MSEDELAQLRYKLDAVAGAQNALTCAINLLMVPYRGNSAAIAALQGGLENVRSSLLASSASDYSIQAFDEIAESLIESLKVTP
nr:hypothetical protein [Massilia sp. PDC64]